MTRRASTVDVPVITLDPTGADHQREAQRLRDAGPVVRVVLPGGLRAWSLTRHELVSELVRHDRVSKDWRHWTAVRTGELSDDNPIVGMIKVTNMVTADGAEHLRLRRPVIRTFTARRVETLTPRIETLTATLLDELPARADASGVVDLRADLSVPLPLQVISELLGVPPMTSDPGCATSSTPSSAPTRHRNRWRRSKATSRGSSAS